MALAAAPTLSSLGNQNRTRFETAFSPAGSLFVADGKPPFSIAASASSNLVVVKLTDISITGSGDASSRYRNVSLRVQPGTAPHMFSDVTITATDACGIAATQKFRMTVRGKAPLQADPICLGPLVRFAVLCGVGCDTCRNETACSTCKPGLVLRANGACCDPSCLSCQLGQTSPLRCTSCDYALLKVLNATAPAPCVHCDAVCQADITPPTLSSVTALGSHPSSTVRFGLVFSKPIASLASGNLDLSASTGVANAGVTQIAGSGTTFTVTVGQYSTPGATGTVVVKASLSSPVTDLRGRPILVAGASGSAVVGTPFIHCASSNSACSHELLRFALQTSSVRSSCQ